MGLEKAIKYGKEKRKPYMDSRAFARSCRNHGWCSYCIENRKHKFRDRHPWGKDEIEEEELQMDEVVYSGVAMKEPEIRIEEMDGAMSGSPIDPAIQDIREPIVSDTVTKLYVVIANAIDKKPKATIPYAHVEMLINAPDIPAACGIMEHYLKEYDETDIVSVQQADKKNGSKEQQG